MASGHILYIKLILMSRVEPKGGKQRQSRLQKDRVHHRVVRAAETPIQHAVRLLGLRKQKNIAITPNGTAKNVVYHITLR
ncbi:hypothetical protein TNCV_3310751 [Trichonephila clavipes]|nr:hypothetical protein TNCV_3310751 [Trichonephila clavipes]